MIKNPVPWPDGARCAVTFTWDMDADSLLHLVHPNDADTRISTNSMLRYGPLIAVERIIDVCAELGVKHTFFVPGWCAERYPEAIRMMVAAGHEVAHHGYLHEFPNEMTRDKERYWTQRGFDAIASVAGRAPRGYRAPWYKFSKYSLEILLELGFTYDCSLMGDDVPHLLRCAAGDLIELPGNWQLDDWPHFVHNHDLDYMMPIKAPREAMACYMAEFEAMWEHRGFWVNCFHPFCSGQVSRMMMVRDMIREMQARGGVWFATGEEVAAHARALITDGAYTARVDELPYYDGRLPEFGEG
jgi:peptidoglycan/xylan/chitin deacetylase (PgdA/CDA1 family)